MKRLIAFSLIAILICGSLFGCAKSADTASIGAASGKENGIMEEIAPGAPNNAVSDSVAGSGTGISTGASSTAPVATEQKLIRKIRLTVETEDLDAALKGIDSKIAELSGYAENREVYHNRRGGAQRSANLTIRIPVAQMDSFVTHVSDLTNVLSSSETADDITLTYIATQSRVDALQTEHDRLLELLAKADTMYDLLEIESRLTSVRAELETVASTLKLYDNLVDYSTVYLNLSEVNEYTDTTEPETVWQRIGKGFQQTLSDIGIFFTELFIAIIVGFPYILIVGLLVTGAVLLIKRHRKKKNKPETTEEK